MYSNYLRKAQRKSDFFLVLQITIIVENTRIR